MSLLITLILVLALEARDLSAQAIANPAARYLFYLHGRIVEDQGAAAKHPEFGVYDYAGIVRQFKDSGFVVVSEMRRPKTDVSVYADSVASQVRRLISGGVPASHIAVVGASKGAGIAMLVSTRVTSPIRYVILANCNDYALKNLAPKLNGDVLSIYEESDSLGRSCTRIFAQSPGMVRSGEIRLQTGLKHGFIYRPLAGWIGPAVGWAKSAEFHEQD
ncbi:MAG TPA: alpha/beta hydrolase [Gemmatimonadales bacterium]|nr:alpha/beta hydrolase [Gemmatimonadales bacterium]